MPEFEAAGMKFVGHDVDNVRMEIMELDNHPYYVAVQYHPEKNMFEWTEKYSNIPHTQDAVHIAAFESQFFIEVNNLLF